MERSPRLQQISRQGGALALAVPVFLSGLLLRREVLAALSPASDPAVHHALVRWVARRIESGHSPLDGWFAYLSGGLPAIHEYQTLPHLLTGAAAAATGATNLVGVTTWLALTTLPVSMALGVRLLGASDRQALAAAWVAPLMSSFTAFGFEWHAFVQSGLGLWSMLWCLWLAPIAIGASARSMLDRRFAPLAGATIGLCVVCHFTLGYFVAFAAVVAVATAPGPLGVGRRAATLGAFAAGAIATSMWLLVPLAADSSALNRSALLQSSSNYDGYGLGKLARWYITGDLFDAGRLPVLTLAVAISVVALKFGLRRDHGGRLAVALLVTATLLTAGRASLGPLFDVLPGASDLLAHRYLAAMHLSAMLVLGLGLGGLADRAIAIAHSRPRRGWATPVALLATVGLAATAWVGPASTADLSGDVIDVQRGYLAHEVRDATALMDRARRDGAQRIYAGRLGAPHQRVAPDDRAADVALSSAVYVALSNDLDSVGYSLRTLSLLTDVEIDLDPADPVSLRLWNVSHLLLPTDIAPRVHARLVARRGNLALWHIDAPGYLGVVDTVGPPLRAERSTIRSTFRRFLAGSDLRRDRYPVVGFGALPASHPTATGITAGDPGEVLEQSADLDAGRFRARVDARREAAVLLRAAYHPRVTATIDGRPTPVRMVAPAMMAVTVPPGSHAVEFRYQPFRGYLWIGLASIALLVLVVGWSRRSPLRDAAAAPTHASDEETD